MLTCPKGVYQFRYFLPQCVYRSVVVSALCIPIGGRIRIVAHFNTNAYMHEQSTMGLGIAFGQEVHVPKLIYAFCTCKPVFLSYTSGI